MKSGAYALFIFFWICTCVHPHVNGQQLNSVETGYTLKHFTPDNGLGSVQARGIVQDKHGFIWIGSRELISRFDGYNFKVYKFDPKNLLESSYTGGILSLYTDREKNLWIRSELFSKYDPKTDSP